MLQKTSTSSLSRGFLLCGLAASTTPFVLVGCGSSTPESNTPPVSAPAPQANAGLTTKQKLTLLAGAAAMYYLYRKFQRDNEAKLGNQKIQYYISKSTGRIYYRDPQNPQKVTWVTPPPSQVGTIQIPSDQAQEYSNIRGYNNSNSGQALTDLLPTQ